MISHYDNWDNLHKIVTISNVGALNVYAYNEGENYLMDMTRNQKYINARVVEPPKPKYGICDCGCGAMRKVR